jgi:hypothetical protein
MEPNPIVLIAQRLMREESTASGICLNTVLQIGDGFLHSHPQTPGTAKFGSIVYKTVAVGADQHLLGMMSSYTRTTEQCTSTRASVSS